MKAIKTTSFFKKVGNKEDARFGQKRENLNWTHQLIEAEDVATLPADQVAKVVTKFIEDFGRKLIASNGADWNYQPTEQEANFAKAFEDMQAERTSTRILTKESLAAFGLFYKEKAIELLGVPAAAATMGEKIIAAKLANVAGKNDVLEVFIRRIESLVEVAPEDEILPHAEVVEKLLELAQELKAVSVSAEML